MNLLKDTTVYFIIAKANDQMQNRRKEASFWRKKIQEIKTPIIKVAFDTRRIDQETQIIPRRNLQNYNRSEQFITETMNAKIEQLKRLQNILNELKEVYGKQIEWQDSYARILLSSIDNAIQKNGEDITDTQPGLGSLDYIEELLYARYRLILDSMLKMDDVQIKEAVLKKDDNFKTANVVIPDKVKQMVVDGNDTLLEKLFNVKATKEHPNIERTITITIKDKLLEE